MATEPMSDARLEDLRLSVHLNASEKLLTRDEAYELLAEVDRLRAASAQHDNMITRSLHSRLHANETMFKEPTHD
jgi:hypothetical protein